MNFRFYQYIIITTVLLLGFNNCSSSNFSSELKIEEQRLSSTSGEEGETVSESDEPTSTDSGQEEDSTYSSGELTLSGGFSQNQILTISGKNFGLGPNVVIYDDFTGTPGDAISLDSARIGAWASTDKTYISRFHEYGFSGQSFSMSDDSNSSNLWGRKPAQLKVRFDPTQEVFMSYQVAVPPGKHFSGADRVGEFGPSSHWKLAWLMDGDSGYRGGEGQADVCVPTNGQSKGLQISGNSDKIGWVANLESDFDLNDFNRMSTWLKADPSAPQNQGYTWFQMVSKKIGKTKTVDFNKSVFNGEVTSPTSAQWTQVNLPGWYGNGDQSNTGGVYDDFYLAIGPNSPARVEVGSLKNYEDNTDLTILPSTYWSNTELKVIVKSKGNSDIHGKYLFIFNGKNELIQTSIAIP